MRVPPMLPCANLKCLPPLSKPCALQRTTPDSVAPRHRAHVSNPPGARQLSVQAWLEKGAVLLHRRTEPHLPHPTSGDRVASHPSSAPPPSEHHSFAKEASPEAKAGNNAPPQGTAPPSSSPPSCQGYAHGAKIDISAEISYSGPPQDQYLSPCLPLGPRHISASAQLSSARAPGPSFRARTHRRPTKPDPAPPHAAAQPRAGPVWPGHCVRASLCAAPTATYNPQERLAGRARLPPASLPLPRPPRHRPPGRRARRLHRRSMKKDASYARGVSPARRARAHARSGRQAGVRGGREAHPAREVRRGGHVRGVARRVPGLRQQP
jgi:hypothetical protein